MDETTQASGPAATNPVAAAEAGQAAPAEPSAPEHAAEEIPVGGASASGQELEVEIRDHGGAPEPRSLALDALQFIRDSLPRMSQEAAKRVQALVRDNLSSDYLDPDFWRGLGMVFEYQVKELRALIERRARGEHSTDPYGMDAEVVEAARPIAAFLYRSWWRVQTRGLDHVPASGAALLVANHSGALPWDAAMIATAILEEHPSPRVARTLHDRWASAVPGLAPALAALGQVPALPENAERLLGEGELVTAFPEGERGPGKLFRDRYKLEAFEAAPLVRAALRTGAPIVPVAVIGAEETYPALANLAPLAKLLRLPYLHITPFFPLFGPLGLIPLPSRWTITFDAPIGTAGYGAAAADDTALVSALAAQLRDRVAQLLERGLAARSSVFLG